MPTIRVTTGSGAVCVTADRVVRDSAVVVVERRTAGRWEPVAVHRTEDVLAIERAVPLHGGEISWLPEDVRAGLGLAAARPPVAATPRSRLRWLGRTLH